MCLQSYDFGYLNISSSISVFLQEFEFTKAFQRVLQVAEDWGRSQAKMPKQMRTFEESAKSKKTVSSMIERKGDDKENKPKKGMV